MVGRLYLEHLSDADLALLSSAGEPARAVHADPERIEALIDSPALFRVLFGAASFVEEWVGPRQRVPVFDVAGLREFGADPLRRFFLAELLASYTHVASGSVMVQTRRGWRRQRFSELDPLRLIELAELLPEAER